METIGITVKLGKENLVFHQKVISVSEENRLRQRLFGLTEQEREEQAFDLTVDALAQYEAEQMELISFDEKGEKISTPMSVRAYFAERTVIKERIAEYAMRGFLLAITPNIDFF